MTATAHALIAGSITASTGNPALGISASFISHPLLDLVPHWDFGANWRRKTKTRLFLEASFDLIAGVGLTFLIFGSKVEFWYLAAAIFVAEIWDLAEAPYWIMGWKKPPFSWIYGIQSRMQNKAGIIWGIVTQITVVGVALLLSGAI